MPAPQTKFASVFEASFSGLLLRSVCNRWVLLGAVGLILIGAAVVGWSWLVAAGIAWIVLSILPCLVCCLAMCGMGLCMHKLIGRSGSVQTSGSAVAEQSEGAARAVIEGSATYVASCCGDAAGGKPAKLNWKRKRMRKLKVVLLLASSLFAAAAASAIVYAEPVHSHSMMGGGTMGRMGGMMEHCSAMMSGGTGHGRPNEQWRNHPSPAPDGDK